MLIRHANAYINGHFIPEMDVRIHNGHVQEIGQGLINGLYEDVIDLQGDYLLPGFIDVHIHAFMGHDTMQGEEAIRAMCRELYKQGVAAFCPTTMSASVSDTRKAIGAIHCVMQHPDAHAATVLGAHMEAPFLQPEKAGAQLCEFFTEPSMDQLRQLCGSTEAVRIVTMAPERNGSEALIRDATGQGITISIGHTAATCEQTHLAADWGATHVTHTFNAQSLLHHRAPGVPGAAMTDDRLYAELICDGIHLHEDIIRLMVRAKGAERIVAITDAMEAAGMPDGQYSLGGQAVFVQHQEARLADGTLAGSVLTMKQALWNLIHRFGIAPEQAVMMCTQTPAESIGETKAGRIVPGSPAPLTRWTQEWEMAGILA